MKRLSEARLAIIHEWPVEYAGSEQVVAAMLEAFPQAEPFALIHDREALRGTPLEGVAFRTSFIQSLPRAKEKYRSYLPLMPLAVEQFDLRSYDIVISSSHAVAKGVLTSANQLHISYTHTPVRYAWDLYLDYLADSGMEQGIKSWLARAVLHYIRLWDVSAANRVGAEGFESTGRSEFLLRSTPHQEALSSFGPSDLSSRGSQALQSGSSARQVFHHRLTLCPVQARRFDC